MAENADGPAELTQEAIGTSGSYTSNGSPAWGRLNLVRHGTGSTYTFPDGHVEMLNRGEATNTSLRWSAGISLPSPL